jgi:hypothetical protein
MVLKGVTVMNLKKIVENEAPFLGSMLSTAYSAGVCKLLSKELLQNENATTEDIIKVIINATPGQLLKLKELDAEYSTKLTEIGIDAKKINSKDKENANHNVLARRDYIPSIIAIMITLGFFSVLAIMMFYPIQADASNVIDVLLGALGTAWISCVSYYFGSSYEAHNMNSDKFLEQKNGASVSRTEF